jgi:hypothetical protein
MTITAQTENWRNEEFLLSEAEGTRSRENITLITGQDLVAGTVLGQIKYGTPTVAYSGGHTGTATVGTITTGSSVQLGDYVLTCTTSANAPDTTATPAGTILSGTALYTLSTAVIGSTAVPGTYVGTFIAAGETAVFTVRDPTGNYVGAGAAGTEFVGGGLTFTATGASTFPVVGNTFTYVVPVIATGGGGVFTVVAPDGTRLPDAVIATAYTNAQLNFTINDGDTNWAAGWIATITVVAGSLKYTQHDQDATDGSQYGAGILCNTTDATSADVVCPIIIRDAEVKGDILTWQSDIDAGEKTSAIVDLNNLGIFVR